MPTMLEYSNCASIPSSQLQFLPYTRNVAVQSDSLQTIFTFITSKYAIKGGICLKQTFPDI